MSGRGAGEVDDGRKVGRFCQIIVLIQEVFDANLSDKRIAATNRRHLFYHFAIYIHGVISYSLNEYLILFSCALKRVYARYSEKDVP